MNSFLLTERCNNYCLMCSQPPRDVDDGWIVEEMLELLPLMPRETPEVMLSGGEPSLLRQGLLDIVRAAKSYLPETSLHILSNGRGFADRDFAEAVAAIAHPDLMIGIPLYADVADVHDYVVQARGAFDETLRGILNLKRSGVAVEIRVVLHKQTIPRLVELARFLTRNLLFVDHVALMGLEWMGFARAHENALWIDPVDYQDELRAAVGTLDRARIKVSIYNCQLCTLERSLWKFAKRSISDWKQEYESVCNGCQVTDRCAGFFSSSAFKYSRAIGPIRLDEMAT